MSLKTKEAKLVGAKEHNLVSVQFLDVSLVKRVGPTCSVW